VLYQMSYFIINYYYNALSVLICGKFQNFVAGSSGCVWCSGGSCVLAALHTVVELYTRFSCHDQKFLLQSFCFLVLLLGAAIPCKRRRHCPASPLAR